MLIGLDFIFAACPARIFCLARAIIFAAQRAQIHLTFDNAKVINFHCESKFQTIITCENLLNASVSHALPQNRDNDMMTK